MEETGMKAFNKMKMLMAMAMVSFCMLFGFVAPMNTYAANENAVTAVEENEAEASAQESDETVFFLIMGGGFLIILFAVVVSVASASSCCIIADQFDQD